MKPKKYNGESTISEKVQTCGVTERCTPNPIESMEREISYLKETVINLKLELLDCYRRLDTGE